MAYYAIKSCELLFFLSKISSVLYSISSGGVSERVNSQSRQSHGPPLQYGLYCGWRAMSPCAMRPKVFRLSLFHASHLPHAYPAFGHPYNRDLEQNRASSMVEIVYPACCTMPMPAFEVSATTSHHRPFFIPEHPTVSTYCTVPLKYH